MSLTEFLYPIFQAYDWLHLNRTYNCNIQVHFVWITLFDRNMWTLFICILYATFYKQFIVIATGYTCILYKYLRHYTVKHVLPYFILCDCVSLLINLINYAFQIGGSDQMGNMVAGHELVSRMSHKEVYGTNIKSHVDWEKDFRNRF